MYCPNSTENYQKDIQELTGPWENSDKGNYWLQAKNTTKKQCQG
jgi:hypothetical protein